MRMVLIHGINQQGKDAAALRDEWCGHLAVAMGNPAALDGIDVAMPFYGDILKRYADGRGHEAIAQGADGAPDLAEAQFLASALMETAVAAGIGNAAIAAEQRRMTREEGAVAEQSLVMNRRFNAIVRVLEQMSPVHGRWVMRILKQAHVYANDAAAAAAVDAVVRPALGHEPTVVVAHSLGTVVAFKLLRALAQQGEGPASVPLFVTVGSPLPLMAIQAALGPAFARPASVGRWVNAYDPDDFITLGKPLDDTTFGIGTSIVNIGDVDNDRDDPHAIGGYLRDPRVAKAIAEACDIG